jgi:hypothetical protein
MTLQTLLAEGRLRRHRTSAEEISALLQMVDRDLHDASLAGLSVDRCFTTAYSAALQLATIVLRALGYRTSGSAHHWTTFQALSLIQKPGGIELADYFDSCRRKRNVADYDAAGMISNADAGELLQEVKRFHKHVLTWMSHEHPQLIDDKPWRSP